MSRTLNEHGLDLLFRQARTSYAWRDEPVDDSLLRRLYDLAKLPPTSANCQPMRLVFVKSPGAKERLRPALDKGNVEKTMAAPVTAIVAHDLEFYEKLPKLMPHTNARSWYAGKDEKIAYEAFRSGSLQGAYLILAARALGLDCGPMGGFDRALVDRTFLPDGTRKSNFLCNLGIGDFSRAFPRSPRLDFEEACSIV